MLHGMDTVFGEDVNTKNSKRGCTYLKKHSEMIQDIRMCIQTFFNLYGYFPTKQVLVEWLGASYEKEIPGLLK